MSNAHATSVKKSVVFVIANSFLLATIYVLFCFSDNFIHNVFFGALVGAIAATSVCLMMYTLEKRQAADRVTRHFGMDPIVTTLAGSYLGGIVTSVLVIFFGPMTGLVIRSLSLFPCDPIMVALVGLVQGTIMGGAIGALWSRLWEP